MCISKSGIPLTSLGDWERLAPPKSSNHWVDGRSAKEVARAWLEGKGTHLPQEVQSLLAGHHAFGPVLGWHAEPEAKLWFDDFPGEPRNSDLIVYVKDSHGLYVIAVEAKADESFGETVGDALKHARERYLANNRSNGLKRIEQLSQSLLGPDLPEDTPLHDIRYQLLTATAGALWAAESHDCTRTLLLIHEFVTNRTTDDNHARNAANLDSFVHRISHGRVKSVGRDVIQGPFEFPTQKPLQRSVALYIAKVSCNLRGSRADSA